MSTPIFRTLCLLVPMVLAGCVDGLGLGLGGGGGNDAPRDVQVTADLVTITGPRGFCVDPTATGNSGDTGFVLLGNCAAISGEARAPQPNLPAVLTAAVSARSTGANLTDNLSALDAFFRSDDGRRLLSRSGNANSVEILDTRTRGDIFLLHARDTSAGALPGVAQDYWRVYLDVGPRLATLSVLALADADVSNEDAFGLLTRFASAVTAANTGLGRSPAPAPVAADETQPGDEAAPAPFPGGFFRNIFR